MKMNDLDAWTFACSPELIPWLPVNEKNGHDLDADDYDFGQAPMLFQENTYDLSDLLIAPSAPNNTCESVITFDKKASKFYLFECAA
ncbi:MAG: hypothetical protein KJ737_02950 [Proteobacteria bacterium]|nr:hypothetical protein [Pseudomonadota bacterium]